MEALRPTKAACAPAEPHDPSLRHAIREVHREKCGDWLVLTTVWTVCAVYLGVHLRQGWYPFDSGVLNQMADRVLRGQVPGHDFIDPYTGGLDYLNALAFRLFGVNLFSLRIPLFLFFLGWVPSVYFIARRFVAPLTAGAIALLAVAWSVPNYPEAMPSWYNLIFATWGMLALLRYTETERRRWLWVAGICGGLSFLAKITALYFVAAALLYFVFRELSLFRSAQDRSSEATWSYCLFASAGLLLFLAAVAYLISQRPLFANYFYFVLPSACLVVMLLWHLWREKSTQVGVRFRRLLAMGLPFIIGFLVPISVFLIWLTRMNAVDAWAKDTFAMPTARFQWGAGNPTPVAVLLGLAPAVLILYFAGHSHPAIRRLARYGSLTLLPALLILAWHNRLVYAFLGNAPPLAIPLIGFGVILGLGRTGMRAGENGQKVFLLAGTAVCCALIQFPLSVAIYFCYVAPLAILATVALLSLGPGLERVALGSLLIFYLVFGIWLRTPGYFEAQILTPDQPVVLHQLQLVRAGGLLVKPRDAEEYKRLISLVKAHARGHYIYCTPDCPEVYFLSEKLNPTGTIVDLLDPDYADPSFRTERILETLDSHGVSAVVLLDWRHAQSGRVPSFLRSALDKRYPDSRKVGLFEVRWKP